jgi:hypothetical protein
MVSLVLWFFVRKSVPFCRCPWILGFYRCLALLGTGGVRRSNGASLDLRILGTFGNSVSFGRYPWISGIYLCLALPGTNEVRRSKGAIAVLGFYTSRMVLQVESYGKLVAVSAPFVMHLRDSDIRMNVPITCCNKQPMHVHFCAVGHMCDSQVVRSLGHLLVPVFDVVFSSFLRGF